MVHPFVPSCYMLLLWAHVYTVILRKVLPFGCWTDTVCSLFYGLVLVGWIAIACALPGLRCANDVRVAVVLFVVY